MKAKQQGFTLVELVVVIVILGILAATALPKFIDVSADARTGVMKGVEASMRAVNTMVYSKAAANSQLGASGTVTVNGSAVSTVCGYLAVANMNGLLDLNPTSDFNTATAGTVKHANATDSANCKVVYAAPPLNSGACDSASVPSYTLTSSGC